MNHYTGFRSRIHPRASTGNPAARLEAAPTQRIADASAHNPEESGIHQATMCRTAQVCTWRLGHSPRGPASRGRRARHARHNPPRNPLRHSPLRPPGAPLAVPAASQHSPASPESVNQILKESVPVRHRMFAATFLTRCAFPPDTEFCLGSFIVRLILYPALPGLKPETERQFRSDSG